MLDDLFASADSRRNQDHAMACHINPFVATTGEISGSIIRRRGVAAVAIHTPTMAHNRFFKRTAEQKEIAKSRVITIAQTDMQAACHEVWVQAAKDSTTRVILHITNHSRELTTTNKQGVIVVGVEKDTASQAAITDALARR